MLKIRNRRAEHREYLWKSIYQLRLDITNYVLKNVSNNTNMFGMDQLYHWDNVKRKAELIQKYSKKLKKFEKLNK
tara:strand:- start:450 stop:674 length:225 start_codon:yes stop_codon:yes gene_type:complete